MHSQQHLNQKTLAVLKEFIQSREVQVDMQEAKLKVVLHLTTDADQYCFILSGVCHTFDISIKLIWNAARSCVENLCRSIGFTSTMLLEIDGITLDTHPQGRVKYLNNFFSNHIFLDTNLKL